jgi:hypothetical protein
MLVGSDSNDCLTPETPCRATGRMQDFLVQGYLVFVDQGDASADTTNGASPRPGTWLRSIR